MTELSFQWAQHAQFWADRAAAALGLAESAAVWESGTPDRPRPDAGQGRQEGKP
jgi:hypothetical protein